MKELDVDVFALQTADTQDARKRFSGDWTARLIAVMCVLFFGSYIFMVTIQEPNQNSDAVINLVLGYLGGIVSSIISFYFGASQSDSKNND
jgi:ABC-type enterochelin transport system permease subunit